MTEDEAIKCEVCESSLIDVSCPDCNDDTVDDCETCNGEGTITECPNESEHPVG